MMALAKQVGNQNGIPLERLFWNRNCIQYSLLVDRRAELGQVAPQTREFSLTGVMSVSMVNNPMAKKWDTHTD